MAKNPAFQFYPGDWFREPGLRACSLAARGAWAEILFTLHDTPERGRLCICLHGLGRMLSIPALDVEPDPYERHGYSAELVVKDLANNLVCELEFLSEDDKLNFWSVDSCGEGIWFYIINRRMHREYLEVARISAIRAEAGAKGGRSKREAKGLQNLAKDGSKEEANSVTDLASYDTNIKQTPKQNIASSSSSSSSVQVPSQVGVCVPPLSPFKGEKKHRKLTWDEICFPEKFDTLECRESLKNWWDYKLAKGEGYKTHAGISAIFNRFKANTREQLINAINFSMSNNYAGIFLENKNGNGPYQQPMTKGERKQQFFRNLEKEETKNDEGRNSEDLEADFRNVE